MFKTITRTVFAACAVLAVAGHASAAEGEKPPRQSWSFAGPFGQFDRAQLQRGFKVYREVCSTCHSLRLVAFRNLSDKGGPAFSEAQVKALAANNYKVMGAPNEKGDVDLRPALPADYFPLVFPNDNAAAASNGGSIPPDLSLMARARGAPAGFPGFIINAFSQYQEGGPDYIHALIADGYAEGKDVPAGVTVPTGKHYNKFFAGHILGMPKPLADGQVEYTDGTPQTVDQYSRDVAAFLAWTADPGLDARKEMGFKVMIFLLILAGLLYVCKKRVWADVAH